MSIEINPRELFEQILVDGAVLLPQFLPHKELEVLDSGCRIPASLIRRAPVYGSLVMGLAEVLDEPTIDPRSFAVQAQNPHKVSRFHVDDQGRFGISLLMPVSGPDADFYYSEIPQDYPSNMNESLSVRYGLGDVIVLRQELTVRRPDRENQTRYTRVYHHGVASQERQLAVCDMMAPLVTLDQKAASLSV